MRLILCNGVFDLLHPGHVAHLEEARSMGDHLVVGLTLSAYVGKPGRPIQTWAERARMLRALRCVSDVWGCKDSVDAILNCEPTIFVKGGDYKKRGLLKAERDACAKIRAKIAFTRYVPTTTTSIIERIKACEF